MRKNKFRKKGIFFKFLAIQCVIFLLFSMIMYMSQPVDKDKVQNSIIVVDDTQFVRVAREYRFIIFSNGIQYSFSNSPSSGLSNTELYNTVQIGDEISIQYIEKCGLLGKKNWVLDAQTDTEKLRCIEKYYEDKAKTSILVIVIFALIEILFLTIIFIYAKFLRRLYTEKMI